MEHTYTRYVCVRDCVRRCASNCVQETELKNKKKYNSAKFKQFRAVEECLKG